PPRPASQTTSPPRPSVSAITPAFPLTSAATTTAGPSTSRGTAPAGPPASAAIAIPEGRSLAAGARLIDHERAALVFLAVHGRDGVGGFLHRHLHKPEPARGNEAGFGHWTPCFKLGPQLLLGKIIGQIPHVKPLRRHNRV